ncbi:hypothetical protein FB451DRAFT_1516834 [Mycena latifolia]|nr:hypothetical protein FB451DRAFT_1516834 [Mycena latifolia]
MASDAVVDNLTFLSNYLDTYRNRVSSLEDELSRVRRDTSTQNEPSASLLSRLEGEKAALKQEVTALQDALKAQRKDPPIKEEAQAVKLEPGTSVRAALAPAEPNTVLADARKMLQEERELREALERKCTALEKKVKESAELAAKAFRERVEGEQALDKMRIESAEAKKKLEDIQLVCEELTAAKAAAVGENASDAQTSEAAHEDAAGPSDPPGEVRAPQGREKHFARGSFNIFDPSFAPGTQLGDRQMCDANAAALEDKASAAQTSATALAAVRQKYEALKAEKLTLRKVHFIYSWRSSARWSLNELEAQVAVLNDKISGLKTKYNSVKKDHEELQQTCREMIELVESLQEDVKANAALGAIASEKYRKFLKALPVFENRPCPVNRLDAVCYKKDNLYAYLAQDKNAKRFLPHVLYLPKRTIGLDDSQSFIAFGPSHRYDPTTKQWVEGSDLARFHGETRELFTNWNDTVLYMGTYMCHDLQPLFPEGTNIPSPISPTEIIDAMFGVPRPLEYSDLIGQRYSDSRIKVVATGLQRHRMFGIELGAVRLALDKRVAAIAAPAREEEHQLRAKSFSRCAIDPAQPHRLNLESEDQILGFACKDATWEAYLETQEELTLERELCDTRLKTQAKAAVERREREVVQCDSAAAREHGVSNSVRALLKAPYARSSMRRTHLHPRTSTRPSRRRTHTTSSPTYGVRARSAVHHARWGRSQVPPKHTE